MQVTKFLSPSEENIKSFTFSSFSSSLARLSYPGSPILLEALILRTFPGFPSLMKTFPSTAFLVSLVGSFMVE